MATYSGNQTFITSTPPTPAPAAFHPNFCDSSWRFLVTGVGGGGISILDHLATGRIITPKLNEPLEVSGVVSSENPSVNQVRADNLPFVAEGARQLYCFRRESNEAPYYTIRASTLIMQVDDAAVSNAATTRFTAWDPWMYMFSRPVLQSDFANGNKYTGEADYINGTPIGGNGLIYGPNQTTAAIVLDMIATTQAYPSGADELGNPIASAAPPSAQDCFIDATTLPPNGTFSPVGNFFGPYGYKIEQGTSLGQALQDMCSTGKMDIVFHPIYDPIVRPGILCEVELMSQESSDVASQTDRGAGIINYSAIFAWDRPGRSTTGMDNLYDGTGRANVIQGYNGQGGPPVPLQTNVDSIKIYGDYWAQPFFPKQPSEGAAVSLAQEQLELRANGKQTLTVNPAAGRAPDPFLDYNIGDIVPVYASTQMRQAMPPDPSPALNPPVIAWQRIYGIPIEIDDNGSETVRQLIVGIVGGPVIGGPPVGTLRTTQVSIGASSRPTQRVGAAVRP